MQKQCPVHFKPRYLGSSWLGDSLSGCVNKHKRAPLSGETNLGSVMIHCLEINLPTLNTRMCGKSKEKYREVDPPKHTKKEMRVLNLAGPLQKTFWFLLHLQVLYAVLHWKQRNKKCGFLLPLLLTKYGNKYTIQTWHFYMETVFCTLTIK